MIEGHYGDTNHYSSSTVNISSFSGVPGKAVSEFESFFSILKLTFPFSVCPSVLHITPTHFAELVRLSASRRERQQLVSNT